MKLIADTQHGELLGTHLTATELARNIHTYPTLSEALQEGFHGLTGHRINL